MITYSAEKFPSDPVYSLFECLFYAFLNAWESSFDVILTKNELCPLMFSHHWFIRLRSLFSLVWLIGAAVGST